MIIISAWPKVTKMEERETSCVLFAAYWYAFRLISYGNFQQGYEEKSYVKYFCILRVFGKLP